jgi:hypothetical protein
MSTRRLLLAAAASVVVVLTLGPSEQPDPLPVRYDEPGPCAAEDDVLLVTLEDVDPSMGQPVAFAAGEWVCVHVDDLQVPSAGGR